MSTGAGVAIVGMACLFPGAEDLDAYWHNIVAGMDATSEPPPEAWDPAVYYDPEFADTDRTYCQRGGYLGGLARFEPLAHGIPPVAVGGEPDQWLALRVASDALADARQGELPEQVRARTAVVLGKGTYLNGGNAIAVQRMMVIGQTVELIRSLYPDSSEEQLERLRSELQGVLPDLGPETVPGLIPNIIVGRIANRLDLMGPAYTVDAACASSLVAVQQTVRDLLAGDCDLAIAGGSQVWMPVATMNLFCRLGALSRKQQLRAFDRDADGTLLGEGIGAVVLKRAEDAVRDGDRVYAVIRGVGVASDGRGLSVMAPRVEGEELALRRAYEAAGLEPHTVGLIEAHGTGTPVGDVVEIQALTRVFGERDGGFPRCAIGTVKTMIGHTIPAAGIAGLIKTALALHHRVLPPTLNCEEPNPELELERTPFYINTETRPWIHSPGAPRRAGVNAFGFGGINAHAVLEEWGLEQSAEHAPPWDSELFILEAGSAGELRERAQELLAALADGARPALEDLAYTLSLRVGELAEPRRLALVAGSLDDLREKLTQAAERLGDPACERIKTTSGIYFEAHPLGREAKVAFVFPGEGAQYPGMLAELCMRFPEARAAFDRIDGLYAGHARGHLLSDWVFPRPSFSDEERARGEARLMELDIAVEAVLTANAAVHAVLRRLVGRCDALVGHSTGEHSAAMAAGALDLETDDRLAAFCHGLYASYADAAGRHEVPAAVLLALGADAEAALRIAREAGGELFLAMDNCPHQAVLVGEAGAAARARELALAEGLMCEQLPYDRAVHTPLFAPFAEDLRATFSGLPVRAPELPMWSCTTAAPCPQSPDEMRELLVEHWTRPVRFRETIEALYEDGVRIFVEAGPRGNMTSFIEDILRGSDACAVAADTRRRSGTEQLNHLAARLAVHDVELDLEHLFSQRQPRDLQWRPGTPLEPAVRADAAGPAARLEVPLSTTWPMLRLSEEALARVHGAAPADPLRNGHAAESDAVQAAAPAAAAPDDVAVAVEQHLRTMQQFLLTQRDVMDAYLAAPPGIAGEAAPWPLLGTVVVHVPESELVAQRVVDPADEPYLLDHTLGRSVSHSDPDLHALALMPLAMSLEILAEAACCLMPGRVVRGLREVRAQRWIAFGAAPQTLQVSAVRVAAENGVERVQVELRSLEPGGGEPNRGGPAGGDPAVEATVLLGVELPAAPPARLGRFAVEAPARLAPEGLYETMFHGPLWRGVQSLEAVSPDGVRARLRVQPRGGLLREDPAPAFALDPVLLDSAGQLVGFWAAEVLDRGRVVFPFRLRALDLHAPPAPAGEQLECVAAITLQGDQLTSSDIEVLDASGRCVMRLEGWEDKRFEVPERFEPLIRPGTPTAMSESWSAPLAPYPPAAALACRRLDGRIASDSSLWIDVWAGRALSRRERELFAGLTLPLARRLEWLAARTAAKECLIELLAEAHGLELALADVEILPDGRGAPVVHVAALGAERPPLVSLSHTGGRAAALAMLEADGVEGVGIDIELLPGPSGGWVQAAFGEAELRLLDGLDEREEWLLRLWCAREAAAKALGTGITSSEHQPRARALDPARGEVIVEVGERTLVASAQRDGELIVASALSAAAVPAGEVSG